MILKNRQSRVCTHVYTVSNLTHVHVEVAWLVFDEQTGVQAVAHDSDWEPSEEVSTRVFQVL